MANTELNDEEKKELFAEVIKSTMTVHRHSRIGDQLNYAGILKRALNLQHDDADDAFKRLVMESGRDVVTVNVEILTANGLKKKKKFGKNSPYCRLRFLNTIAASKSPSAANADSDAAAAAPSDVRTTSKVPFSEATEWNESFDFVSTSEEIGDVKLIVDVLNGTPLVGEEELYGTAELALRDLKDSFEGSLTLEKKKEKSTQRGNLTLRLKTFKEKSKPPIMTRESKRETIFRSDFLNFKKVADILLNFFLRENGGGDVCGGGGVSSGDGGVSSSGGGVSAAQPVVRQTDIDSMLRLYGSALGLTDQAQRMIIWSVYADAFIAQPYGQEDFARLDQSLNLFQHVVHLPLRSDISSSSSSSSSRIFLQTLRVVATKIFSIIHDFFPIKNPLELYVRFLIDAYVSSDAMTNGGDPEERMSLLRRKLIDCVEQRSKNWLTKHLDTQTSKIKSLLVLAREVQQFCWSVNDPYLKDVFNSVEIDVQCVVNDTLFAKLGQIVPHELREFEAEEEFEAEAIGEDTRLAVQDCIRLFILLGDFTKENQVHNEEFKRWFPQKIFLTWIHNERKEAEDLMRKIVSVDKGLPEAEAGFTLHSSSSTDFIQLLYQRFVCGIWKRLDLPRDEDAMSVLVTLQIAVSELIFVYEELLQEKLEQLLMEEAEEAREGGLRDDGDSPQPLHPNAKAWSFINSLSRIRGSIDRMLKDLQYDDYVLNTAAAAAAAAAARASTDFMAAPFALTKTLLEKKIRFLIEKVLRIDLTQVLRGKNPAHLSSLLTSIRSSTLDDVFDSTAPLISDHLLQHFDNRSEEIALSNEDAHRRLFREFLDFEDVVNDFVAVDEVRHAPLRRRLFLKQANSGEIVAEFLRRKCEEDATAGRGSDAPSVGFQTVYNISTSTLYVKVLHAKNLPAVSRVSLLGGGGCNPFVRVLLLARGLETEAATPRASTPLRNARPAVFEEKNAAAFSFRVDGAPFKNLEAPSLDSVTTSYGAIVIQICHASQLTAAKVWGNQDAIIGQTFVALSSVPTSNSAVLTSAAELTLPTLERPLRSLLYEEASLTTGLTDFASKVVGAGSSVEPLEIKLLRWRREEIARDLVAKFDAYLVPRIRTKIPTVQFF